MLRIGPSGQKITVAHLETHPKCPECLVPMWRVETLRHRSGDPRLTQNRYECPACGEITTLAACDVSR